MDISSFSSPSFHELTLGLKFDGCLVRHYSLKTPGTAASSSHPCSWNHLPFSPTGSLERALLEEDFSLGIVDRPVLRSLRAVMQKRREQEAPLFLPSMLVTSRGDLGLAMHFLWVVVDEGITTPIDQTELKARVENLLAVQRLSLELHVQYQRLFDNVPLGLYHTSREGTILDANPAMVRILGFASAEETIGRLARVLAREMGFSEEKIREVSIAGLLHDIGKIAIPGEIPNKPAKLAPLERAIVEEHPKKGYDIVSSVELLAP